MQLQSNNKGQIFSKKSEIMKIKNSLSLLMKRRYQSVMSYFHMFHY